MEKQETTKSSGHLKWWIVGPLAASVLMLTSHAITSLFYGGLKAKAQCDPVHILKERYAKGEISKQDFEQIYADLQSTK